ncbi:MAG: LysR family transcriptional regulator [Hyphomicrobiaceae bacterium]|nr:LysR family transcriptional regulator [Hyphomicrobiaceae bacterium]MCC0009307.1 LysR family transcriptional regulator [Hyphomicrobiaceae bacterium]
MDWDKLKIFHAAAEAGSFTHAGETLHMSQSAVSRQVSSLEKDLKISLFHRHARGLVLTEQGEMLFHTVAEVMAKLQTAQTLLSDTTTRPSGELKVTAAIGLGTVWITQRLREFLELYPEVRVELNLNDEHVDLSKRAADVALWTREPEQADLIRRPLFSMKVRAYASTHYIRRFGAPTSLQDLDKHRIVSYSGVPLQHLAAITWIETVGREGKEPRVPVFRANSVVALKYAVRSGIGIGMIPDYMVEEESDLVTVLREIDPPTLPILFVYPEELKTSKKVQVLRDFLVAKARQNKI